jgi:uncharacterized protein (DUF924 family)
MTHTPGWQQVYDFWYPSDIDGADLNRYLEIAKWWVLVGANAEVSRFSHIVESAKAGLLNDWLWDSKGRLSLILVLDQFTRGLFAGTPEAFTSDPIALQIAESGFRNGHYASLNKMWERSFFCLPLIHTEGENHAARIQRVIDLAMIERNANPPHLLPIFDRGVELAKQRLETVLRFGRFPHRNSALGRESTRDEIDFLEKG